MRDEISNVTHILNIFQGYTTIFYFEQTIVGLNL